MKVDAHAQKTVVIIRIHILLFIRAQKMFGAMNVIDKNVKFAVLLVIVIYRGYVMRKFGHKFKAKPVTEDGNRFASTLEWKYFKHLELLKISGEIVFFLTQVPFRLPGGKYVCDFQIFWHNGDVEFVDVKGMMTPMSSFKIKQVEEIYPLKIKIVKKGDF